MEIQAQAFLLNACRRGDEADVKKTCELFPELINEKDSKGFTPLIIAAYSNQVAIVDLLLKSGAFPDLQDVSGNTALMGAAFKGYPEIVQILLDAGADVNLRNHQGAPALTFAATFGQLAIARKLLEHGAVINLPDSRGKSSLDHAVMQENQEMVNLLLEFEKKNDTKKNRM